MEESEDQPQIIVLASDPRNMIMQELHFMESVLSACGKSEESEDTFFARTLEGLLLQREQDLLPGF